MSLPDGNLLVVGRMMLFMNEPSHFFVTKVMIMRYLPDGRLDQSFGTAGIVSEEMNLDSIYGVLDAKVDSRGNIFVSTYGSEYGSNQNESLILKYHSDGTRDTSFGVNGQLLRVND